MKSILCLAYLALCLDFAAARPLSTRQSTPSLKNLNSLQVSSNNNKNNNNAAAKVSKAKDGSTIIDDTVQINNAPISAPASELVNGGNNNGNGKLGINVLFHGDGGQSFIDFPNQGVNAGLMGVALLAPDSNLRWGGEDPKDNTGLVRPDGPAHSAAVNQFLTKTLPTIVNFDKSKIFLEGVSGGSLLLSGFMIPTFGASLAVPGAVLGCGGLEPQVKVQGDISKLRLHFQSTTDDLASLKQSIPLSIKAYEKLIPGNAGNVSLVTADASPQGGHCEFDEKAFVSGIQLMTDNYDRILSGASKVAHSVLGNENIYDAGQIKAAAAANAKAAANNQQNNGNNQNNNGNNNGNKQNNNGNNGNNQNNNNGNNKNEDSTTTVNNVKTVTVVATKTVQQDVTKTVQNNVKTVTLEATKTETSTKTVQETATVQEFTTTLSAGKAGITQGSNGDDVVTISESTTTVLFVADKGSNNKNENTSTSTSCSQAVPGGACVTSDESKSTSTSCSDESKSTSSSSSSSSRDSKSTSSSSSKESMSTSTSSSDNNNGNNGKKVIIFNRDW
ncbi:hypothetical protein C8F01DRAFT_1256433 [Mycena amicta]|nr:hypothetical protein C8F01DRAFT_1256433 [Mycena amicta]